ncbi:amine oxidase [Gemmatimonadetes bacterium T265]|nr:amine oxidase [Gemmatimonadetes bacterium T265]
MPSQPAPPRRVTPDDDPVIDDPVIDDPVIVVGAGIAGLVCARALHRAGRRVLVLEREAEPGGRARSRIVDGYTVDRGFQVLFTAYPVLGAALGLAPLAGDAREDDAGLALRRFAPAARVVTAGGASYVGDAFRAPLRAPLDSLRMLAGTALARALPLGDKLRVLALKRLATSLSVDECFADRYDRTTARAFLAARGFTPHAIARFFAPFYGGILLDPALGTSAAILLFTFKMLSEGDAVVPAAGIGAVAARLAAGLPPGALRTRVTVAAVRADGGRARGVVTSDGEHLAAADVVLAAEPPAAARLAATAGVALDGRPDALGSTTLYFAAHEAPLPGRAIWLNASGHERSHEQRHEHAEHGASTGGEPRPAVSHAVTLTDVAPEYAAADAPHGRHLLAASAVGAAAALDDDVLAARMLAELAGMRRAAGLGPVPALAPVAVERVGYAQFAQPPGTKGRRTGGGTELPGLWRASETAHSSSLEGAARGGMLAAEGVLGGRA